jgi:PKD repeat protein
MPSIFIEPAKAEQATTITISDLTFNPKNVTIKVGRTITWKNNDSLIYTLWFVKADDGTTYTKAGKEGLSDPILPNSSWSQTFNEVVTLQYYSFERLWITGFINVIPLVPPVASFTFSPTEPLARETVTFNASQSYDPDGIIVSYMWNFGDGTVITEPDPLATHVYTKDGTYNVTLTVKDDDGLLKYIRKTITVLPVHDVAVISVTPSPTEVTSGENMTISVVVKNEGTVPENFTVTVYSNDTTIDTQTVTNLDANSSKTLDFTWDTTNVMEGSYVIKAEASQVTGETDTADNTLTSDVVVTVKPPPFLIFPFLGIIGLILLLIVIIALAFGAYIYLKRKKTSKT